MERREALSACEAPLADLAIDPPEHRAKAFARLAIDALAFRRSTAAFFGSEPKAETAPERGNEPRAEEPHPVPLSTTSHENALKPDRTRRI